MQEMRVWSLGQEDLLEKEMATHSRILAKKISWIEVHGELKSMWSQDSGTTQWLNYYHNFLCVAYHIYYNWLDFFCIFILFYLFILIYVF